MAPAASMQDVLTAAWSNALSNEHFAAVATEYSQLHADGDLASSLSDAFVQYTVDKGLPPALMAYLRYALEGGLASRHDLLKALLKALETIDDERLARLEQLAPLLARLDAPNQDEILLYLQLIRVLRTQNAPHLRSVLLPPLSSFADFASVSQSDQRLIRELVQDALEPEILHIAAALHDDAMMTDPIDITRVPMLSPALPVELWHGIDSVLAAGPSPDAVLLLSNLVSLRCSRIGCSNEASAAAQLAAFLDSRARLPRLTSMSLQDAVTAALLDLFVALEQQVTMARYRAAAVWSTFAYSRLPRLMESANRLSPAALTIDWQSASKASIRHLQSAPLDSDMAVDIGDDEAPSKPRDFVCQLVHGLLRAGLIKSDLLGDLNIEQSFLSAPDLLASLSAASSAAEVAEALSAFTSEDADIPALAEQLVQQIEAWAQPRHLQSLSWLARALTEDVSLLDIAFVHLKPQRILVPLRRLVDTYDPQNDLNNDCGTAFHQLGIVVLFIQAAIRRYKLGHDLAYALGTNSGFCYGWLTSSSSAFHLKALSSSDRATVSAWIGALYSDSGLSDDLMSGTTPRALLRLAPTIVQQSLAACEVGLLALDTLTGGLSYVREDQLSFTLPGVLTWIASELCRLPAAPAAASMRTLLHEVLTNLATADTIPTVALELAAPSLLRVPDLPAAVSKVLAPFASSTTTSEAVDALAALQAGSANVRPAALRAALQSASPNDLANLVNAQGPALQLDAAALSMPSPRRLGFPLLELWTPRIDGLAIAAEAAMRAKVFEDALRKHSKGARDERRAEAIVKRWRRDGEIRAALMKVEGFSKIFV